MFILTDGKNYVMENPMRIGTYLSTTSSSQATEFSYKQARSLLQRRDKKMSWLKKYNLLDVTTGNIANGSTSYKGNGGAYIGENDINFDETILDKILAESSSILGLSGWDMIQLETYENTLQIVLSKVDSANADIEHALQKYKDDNAGKKPPAHKMAKLGYLLADVRDKRKKVKLCLRYVNVMKNAITYKYDICKIKLELSKVNVDYKGRTEFYEAALKILA